MFEVLNGHVRLRVLNELGIDTIKCDIWDVNEQEALQYLAILNKLRGSESPELRMQLLFKLLTEWSKEKLAELIPETVSYLGKLELLPENTDKIPDSGAGLSEDIVIMHFYVIKEQYVEIMQVFDMLRTQYRLNSSSEALFKLATLFLHKSE